MEISKIEVKNYEKVLRAVDHSIDFHAIIAIHDTTLGPALGGCRLWDYETEEEALEDVLRLAEGMTYKAACAGLALGGGKSVIIGNKRTDEIFLAMGEFVEHLGGLYITAEDVGTSVENMRVIAKRTRYVTGLPLEDGSSGDPSPFTALGVFQGMGACLEEVFGHRDFSKISVAVQGLGHVGTYLSEMLHQAGARLYLSDIDEGKVREAAERFSAEVVDHREIAFLSCDVFAPCALGAVINDETVEKLRCKIVAGAANNQLAEERHGEILQQRGILYAPDFVLNAGGLINVYTELEPEGYDAQRAREKVRHIYDAIKAIIEISKKEGISTTQAAIHLAHERLRQGRSSGREL